MEYTIGEVAKKLKMPLSAIRYYEKMGIFPSVNRQSGIRVFNDEDLKTLEIVVDLKKMRMPLKDIKNYCQLTRSGNDTLEKRNELFNKQHELLINEIKDLHQALQFMEETVPSFINDSK